MGEEENEDGQAFFTLNKSAMEVSKASFWSSTALVVQFIEIKEKKALLKI